MTRNCLKLYLILAALCFANIAQAATTASSGFSISKIKPYLGIEYQYEHIKATDAFHPILSSNFQMGNIFLGAKWHKNFGIEIGYYHTLKTSQTQTNVFKFNQIEAQNLTSVKSRTSFKGFSFDLNLYYPMDHKCNVYAILGLVTMHPTVTIDAVGSTDLAAALNLLRPKNKTVPRLGIGTEVLEKHWGWRLRLMWVYTQNMKYDISDASTKFYGMTANPYLQAVMATAGIFYRF